MQPVAMNQNILQDIPIAWEYVRSVRKQVEVALWGYTEEVRSVAVSVASELVKNAIKYGAVSGSTVGRGRRVARGIRASPGAMSVYLRSCYFITKNMLL